MSSATVHKSAAPDGWHTITPRIVANDAIALAEFMIRVFGATGEINQGRPSVIQIGDSKVMISEAGVRTSMSAFLYVYLEEIDATYNRAVKEGVKVVEPPFTTPYGDRRSTVEDRWGNVWQLASQAKNQSDA